MAPPVTTPATTPLYREDSYLKTCVTTVTAVTNEGFETAESVFYPHGGGQLGDAGTAVINNDSNFDITNTVKTSTGESQLHLIENADAVAIGDEVRLEIDWDRRYRLMRFHSACHLLCAAVNLPVNGGSIQIDRARLDFNCPEGLDKAVVQEKLNQFINQNAPMSTRWITNEELEAQPDLVRTMAVKPPTNAKGTIRLVEFEGIDLQACGGTHVASTGEIGALTISKVENKGKQNRRVTLVLDN